MAESGLGEFVHDLRDKDELAEIKSFIDPVLEIAEVTDRVTKHAGKALLFENNGTAFPVLINAFASEKRLCMAIGRENLSDIQTEIEKIFHSVSGVKGSFLKKISVFPSLFKLSSRMPSRSKRKGVCQQVVITEPDLSILPVLKCWPHDAGRFITLPMVHTIHPETGNTNVGMYRMQVVGKRTTAMHWQRHKTGANHFEAWKKTGKKMPVSVALGGDPVYTYCATAPLPENVDEYILAGFLRKKKVKLVRCISNELYVPSDADIIIEGYVDPSEELFPEGPFGDHTGFYSLAGMYPRFHVTCITHSLNAIYPATIVGIPPQEDAWLIKANEKIFLTPVRLALLPEVTDFHMPDAGVAHNLVVVKINKTFPGQGMKVINSLWGAGQMMFTKYMIVVSGDTDIRNYKELAGHIMSNTDLRKDIIFTRGPLDVLDHSSDSFSFGGKAGIDASVKLPEELEEYNSIDYADGLLPGDQFFNELKKVVSNYYSLLQNEGLPVLIVSLDCENNTGAVSKLKSMLSKSGAERFFRFIVAVDHSVDPDDLFITAWQVLANSDPLRDHVFISFSCLFIDGTVKIFRNGGFQRKWPNIVCSDEKTIREIDMKWDSLGLGSFIKSPSLQFSKMQKSGKDEVIINDV